MTRLAAPTAVAVAALAIGSGAGAASPPATLRVVEISTFEKLVVDSPPLQRSKNQPLSAGDVIIGRSKLVRGSRTIGTASFVGVVSRFPAVQFYGTATLPGGTVSTIGIASLSAKTQTYAIVGGTGRYAGAHGTAAEHALTNGRVAVEYRFAT